MTKLSAIFKIERFTPESVKDIEGKLFFEGNRTQPYLFRFSVLLFLSTVIASLGVIMDSTATVIGAMIIAPLMTPILATTAALVMGNASRAWGSFLLVTTGVFSVIIISAGLGSLGIHIVDLSTNSQITARVSPQLIDLIIAMASGIAGAIAICRSDIADSLPGVAISIALVPPLCCVGISLSAAQWTEALGSFLLFLTNLLSILMAGGCVFALLGLHKAVTVILSHVNKRRVYSIITLGLLLIAIPLTITSIRVTHDTIAQAKITRITNQWVSQYPGDFVITSVYIYGDYVKIIISGSDKPSSIEDLGAKIKSNIKQIKRVDLIYVPSTRYVYS